jgi:hypothetical protein
LKVNPKGKTLNTKVTKGKPRTRRKNKLKAKGQELMAISLLTELVNLAALPWITNFQAGRLSFLAGMKKKVKVKVKTNDARIFAMRRKGRTLKEIGDAIGVSDGVVRARLFSSGKFPGRVPLRNRFPKETARVIFSMYRQGASLREIAEVVEYSHETVRTVLRKSGRVVRRRSPRCSIRGCKNKPFGLGYCNLHWGRARTGRMDERGNLMPLQRFCEKCGRAFYCPPEPFGAKNCMWCRWKPSK